MRRRRLLLIHYIQPPLSPLRRRRRIRSYIHYLASYQRHGAADNEKGIS